VCEGGCGREGGTVDPKKEDRQMWLSKERECVRVNLVRIFLLWSICMYVLWGGRNLVYDCRGEICLVPVE